jgi:hypothetical protein
MGGADERVKQFFFGLSPRELKAILAEYGEQWGLEAGEYAEITFPRWRTGAVRMSGQTAQRLFDLLPPYMPQSERYAITEILWRHMGPSSNDVMIVGRAATRDEVASSAEAHLHQVVRDFQLPVALEARFDWLSDGDVHVKQDLLNRIRSTEVENVSRSIREHVPIFFDQLTGARGEYTQKITHTVDIGKHRMEIRFEDSADAVTIRAVEEDKRIPRPSLTKKNAGGFGWDWLFWVLVVGGIILFAVLRSGG